MPVEAQFGEKAVPPPPYNPQSTKHKLFSRCVTCFCIFLLLLILTLSLLAFYFYTTNKPQIPSYTLEDLDFKSFTSQPDSTVQTEYIVTVKADNPNANIGIIYGENSSVNVFYEGEDLCSGKLPHFHQGPKNVTMMKLDLYGTGEFGKGLMSSSRNSSEIPLLVKVKVPVTIVIHEYPLREMKVFVNFNLVVDNLGPNNKLNVVSSKTDFDYEL